jgi:hypothetical protein
MRIITLNDYSVIARIGLDRAVQRHRCGRDAGISKGRRCRRARAGVQNWVAAGYDRHGSAAVIGKRCRSIDRDDGRR